MMVPRWFQDLSRADFLKSVGLYVMPDRLFLVRMRKDLFRLSVVEEEMREIPVGEDASKLSSLTGWITDEVREVALKKETIPRRQALKEAIHSFLPHFNPGKDPFYICLSSDQVMARPVYLPQAAEENLSQVLEYEIKRLLPFRREEVYYDYLPIGKKGDKVGLLLFAVPKRVLDEILDALSAFGIRPKAVETTATALGNYLLFCTGGITGPALVLGGQDHAWEMIGLDARDNGWRQEPELLLTHWLPQADWIQGPGREIFHNCLRKSPKFFGWGYITDFLLSVKGESLQFEDLLALGKKRLGGDQGITHPFFIPAVGAALRGLRENTFPVDLLPGAGKERRERLLSVLNTCLTILLLIVLLVWGGSYPLKDEIRLRRLQKEVEKIGPSVESLRREEEELKRLNKEISSVSGLHERSGEILRILDELSRIVPKSAYLSNLRYREGQIELRGSAENTSNLVPILERSPLFKNVRFNAPSTRRRDERETFSIKADLE
ncbi:MAG: PilN domain-containing protein [Deltaproteobacteria bacterium]|nr:PilN domain-containing protein [Deltaproteobacteria bacterium]